MTIPLAANITNEVKCLLYLNDLLFTSLDFWCSCLWHMAAEKEVKFVRTKGLKFHTLKIYYITQTPVISK